MIRFYFRIVFWFDILLSLLWSCQNGSWQKTQALEHPEIKYQYGIAVDSFFTDTILVKRGENMGDVFRRFGCERSTLVALNTLSKKQFDVKGIRAGDKFIAFSDSTNGLRRQVRYVVYIPDIENYYVFHLQDSFYIEKGVKPCFYRDTAVSFSIHSGLWDAMRTNGLPVELSLLLSDIYAWSIDFFGLQEGDSVKVLYSEKYIDDSFVQVERIYASQFFHRGGWYNAYFFESDSIRSYFDEQGASLQKTFLRAPLRYKRISSGFTHARRHPIFKIVRPHTGVDYAAPAGTPVHTIGDGTVIAREYTKGGGNTVKIKHNSVYTTAYLHLSRFGKGIYVGARVRQGQVIGYVGATGHSTGPHLDFRVWKNGTPVNPLKIQSTPSQPLPQSYRQQFDSIVREYDTRLEKNI